MIYLFHGSDAGKVRAKAFQWIAAARAKAPDAPYVRIPAEELTAQTLGEALSSRGLFYAKSLVLLDDPFSLAASSELVLENLKELAESENVIGILAPKLLAARAKKIETKSEKVFVTDLAAKAPARGFNGALVNALAARDALTLWKEIIKAERQGDVPEMLHGLLHWKARDLMQKGGTKWTKDEARVLSRELIELLSDSRSGDLSLKENLERFALSVSNRN